jgi:cell division transport system ATP-binding protein
MIQFKEVTKKFPTGNIVLDSISFHINPGEFVVITGPSGAGKTTLARLMIKEFEPDSGEIFIDGENLKKVKSKNLHSLRKKVSVIFQDYKIIPDKTVGENVGLALQIANFVANKIPDRIDHLLNLVGIPDKRDLFPSQLSGGELQRAAIARAIAVEPTILFADEPTGNLDFETATEIIKLLQKINSTQTTVLVATHNLDFIHLADRHFHLEKGKMITENNKEKEKPKKFKEPKNKKNV